MIKHKIFFIETLSPTHVGSGDTSFGIVDNLIQRDPVSKIPVFHASSIKGCLREHMEQYKLDRDRIEKVFGGAEDRPGKVKFYEARLVTLPLRATRNVYYNCTSAHTALDYLSAVKTFLKTDNSKMKKLEEFFTKVSDKIKKESKDFCIFDVPESVEIEDYDKFSFLNQEGETGNIIQEYLGVSIGNFAVFSDEYFKEICENAMPVIARNAIGDDGTSENLFYEEVLPRRSRLWFMLGYEQEGDLDFEKALTDDIIQIGGNASIGYGASKFSLLTQEVSS